MRSQIKLAGFSALLLLVPVCAAAFEKSNIGAPDAKPVEQSNNGLGQQNLAELPGSSTVPAPSEDDESAINIPGLGAIPKLDFGMELLYSGENKYDEVAPESDDDLQIRGTIKHRF